VGEETPRGKNHPGEEEEARGNLDAHLPRGKKKRFEENKDLLPKNATKTCKRSTAEKVKRLGRARNEGG